MQYQIHLLQIILLKQKGSKFYQIKSKIEPFHIYPLVKRKPLKNAKRGFESIRHVAIFKGSKQTLS